MLVKSHLKFPVKVSLGTPVDLLFIVHIAQLPRLLCCTAHSSNFSVFEDCLIHTLAADAASL